MKCYVLFRRFFLRFLCSHLLHFQFPNDKWMINGTQQKPHPFVQISIGNSLLVIPKRKQQTLYKTVISVCLCACFDVAESYSFSSRFFLPSWFVLRLLFLWCVTMNYVLSSSSSSPLSHTKTCAVNVKRTHKHKAAAAATKKPTVVSQTTKLIPLN